MYLSIQESISSLKASWSEAAKSNPGSLNIGKIIIYLETNFNLAKTLI